MYVQNGGRRLLWRKAEMMMMMGRGRLFSVLDRVKQTSLAPTFDPAAVESGWEEFWRKEKRRANENKRGKVVMLLPPPNVTGALHLGHALTVTIQDAIARFHHMQNRRVVWLPGLDHAGIATQSIVEKKLLEETGQTRHDIGREQFIQQVWKWHGEYGDRILNQLRRMGIILDWDRQFFTLDEKRSKAVTHAFVELHKKGLISRKRRMINWCTQLNTAISDIEVDIEQVEGSTYLALPGREKKVEFGVMHRFLYKVEGSDKFLEVDTTRPETIFGDVAVAIHPDDERYTEFHGKHVLHPIHNTLLPIVLDAELVNMELGTGVVKVTPAHDANDYACGLRHNLPEKTIINKDGKIYNVDYGNYNGMDRFDARTAVIEELSNSGLYVKKMDHSTRVNRCSRSGDIIEPLLHMQWFVDCEGMSTSSREAVQSNEIQMNGQQHQTTWFHWLNHIQPWCVSRQLWWGHPIPAYQVIRSSTSLNQEEEWIVASSKKEAEQQLKLDKDVIELRQDPDVLDTWFSSALLPLSALGWPSTNFENDLYPLSFLETGSDILFFWVARMTMLCNQLIGRQPFKKILLHPLIRDKSGRKMSKSLGNVIDPLHVIEGITLEQMMVTLQQGNLPAKEIKTATKQMQHDFPTGIPSCGTDSLRITLASYLQQGRQINMDVQRCVSYRHFCNKIWNATRFCLSHFPKEKANGALASDYQASLQNQRHNLTLADKWILSRLAKTATATADGLDHFQLANSVSALQTFFVDEFCDVYIEVIKPRLFSSSTSDGDSSVVLFCCLDLSLRLFHPFMPFLTEELWQRLQLQNTVYEPFVDTSLINAAFPVNMEEFINEEAEESMQFVISIAHAVRSLKHTRKTLSPSTNQDFELLIKCRDATTVHLVEKNLQDIQAQCRSKVAVVSEEEEANENGKLVYSISSGCTVMMELPRDPETNLRLVDEVVRLEKKQKKIAKQISALDKRLSNSSFLQKASEQVVSQEKAKNDKLNVELKGLQDNLASLVVLQQYFAS